MPDGTAELEGAVIAFLGGAGAADAAKLLATVKTDHDRAETPYHCWTHILHGLGLIWPCRDRVPEFDAVLLAWLNHDRVYDPKASDNEEKSAELGRAMCHDLGRTDLADRVGDLILDTKHQAEPDTAAGRWLVGIDLAILGETEERFAAFEDDIRTEYAHVPEPLYRAGRARVLSGFLERSDIYPVPELKTRFEEQARANLKAALAALTG
jgi:predicted metal-dependent HD superfamily phosphohydrolase